MTQVEFFLALLLVANLAATFFASARRLQEIEHKLNLVLLHFGLDPNRIVAPSNHVLLLAKDPQQRTEAIKAYRQQTGAGLKEAVAMIDQIAADSNGTAH